MHPNDGEAHHARAAHAMLPELQHPASALPLHPLHLVGQVRAHQPCHGDATLPPGSASKCSNLENPPDGLEGSRRIRRRRSRLPPALSFRYATMSVSSDAGVPAFRPAFTAATRRSRPTCRETMYARTMSSCPCEYLACAQTVNRMPPSRINATRLPPTVILLLANNFST